MMKHKIHKKMDLNTNEKEYLSTSRANNNLKKSNVILIIEFIGILLAIATISCISILLDIFYSSVITYVLLAITFIGGYRSYLNYIYVKCENENIKFLTFIFFGAEICLIFLGTFGQYFISEYQELLFPNYISSKENNLLDFLTLLIFNIVPLIVVILNAYDLNIKKDNIFFRTIITLVCIIPVAMFEKSVVKLLFSSFISSFTIPISVIIILVAIALIISDNSNENN